MFVNWFLIFDAILHFDHVFKNSECIFYYCTIQNQRFYAMYAKKNPPSKYLKKSFN